MTDSDNSPPDRIERFRRGMSRQTTDRAIFNWQANALGYVDNKAEIIAKWAFTLNGGGLILTPAIAGLFNNKTSAVAATMMIFGFGLVAIVIATATSYIFGLPWAKKELEVLKTQQKIVRLMQRSFVDDFDANEQLDPLITELNDNVEKSHQANETLNDKFNFILICEIASYLLLFLGAFGLLKLTW